jgi:hypothetical protein
LSKWKVAAGDGLRIFADVLSNQGRMKEKPGNISQEQAKSIAFEVYELLQESGMSKKQMQFFLRLCFTEMKKGKLTRAKGKEIFDFVMKG